MADVHLFTLMVSKDMVLSKLKKNLNNNCNLYLTKYLSIDIINNESIEIHSISNLLNSTVSLGSSVVEHVPEERSVGGSIPFRGTIHFL